MDNDNVGEQDHEEDIFLVSGPSTMDGEQVRERVKEYVLTRKGYPL